jgi:hypothetical protein
VQNRYAGDIGDYVKLALLRAISPDLKLGVAWYLYPDEGHNSDGRHIAYLQRSSAWRQLDPPLFDGLHRVIATSRSVQSLENLGLLDATYSREPLDHGSHAPRERCAARGAWFERLQSDLADSEMVFADPDNGLTNDQAHRRTNPRFGKHMPINEALALAAGRCAVIYHHNSRFKGGHDVEVGHWREQLGEGTLSIRVNAYSCRTFFVINPSPVVAARAEAFCHRWRNAKVRLHR